MANIRIQNKSDKQVNWEKAINFVPLKGEIIIYEKDENTPNDRIKIGDGETVVSSLPFVETEIDYSLIAEVNEKIENIENNYAQKATTLSDYGI